MIHSTENLVSDQEQEAILWFLLHHNKFSLDILLNIFKSRFPDQDFTAIYHAYIEVVVEQARQKLRNIIRQKT